MSFSCSKDSDNDEKKSTEQGTIAVGNLSESEAATLNNSPEIDVELNAEAVTAGQLAVSSLLQSSDLSVGGCMAWAVRKDAKIDTSDIITPHKTKRDYHK